MALAKQVCKNATCGREFRPPDRRRRTRCPQCAESYYRSRKATPAAKPVDVPTWAKLDSVRGCNRPVAEFALKLARKTSTVEDKALRPAERDEYVRRLVEFAENAASGRIPQKLWQLRYLGHIVTASAA